MAPAAAIAGKPDMEYSPATRQSSQATAFPSLGTGTQRLRGQTPEQACHVGTMLFHPHRLQIRGTGPRFEMTAAASHTGAFTIATLRYTTPVTVSTNPYETAYQVNVALKGTFKTTVGQQQLEISNGRAAVYRPDVDTAFSGWDRPCLMLAIKIDRQVFERIASVHLGRQLETPIDFSPHLHVQDGPGAAWLASVRRLAGVARQEILSPQIVAQIEEQAVLGLLWSADHSLHDSLEGSNPASMSSLRRAIELIETLPEEPLNLEALSYVAGASGRALQLAFRKHLELSPMQYLKTVRLDRAASALSDVGAQDSSVAEIARRFGFTHMGRFSADYAKRHGELPSVTRLRSGIIR